MTRSVRPDPEQNRLCLLTADYSECLRGCSPSTLSSASDVTDYSEYLLLSGFTDYSEHLWAVRFCTADRRPQTADRRPQTADRRPQTADRRPQTADRSLV